MLESNTGYTQLHGMLVEAGDRSLARLWVACRHLLEHAGSACADSQRHMAGQEPFLPSHGSASMSMRHC